MTDIILAVLAMLGTLGLVFGLVLFLTWDKVD